MAVSYLFRCRHSVIAILSMSKQRASNREFCAQRGIGEKTYYYWLRKVREAAAASAPQLVRLEEVKEAQPLRMIEIRYGEAELKLPEDVDLKAVAVLLNALRHHD